LSSADPYFMGRLVPVRPRVRLSEYFSVCFHLNLIYNASQILNSPFNKSLADKDKFEMTGVSEDVREILKTTGFDQFLQKE